MYLSRLILNPRSRQVRKEIEHPYEMHRTILRAFPKHMAEQGERNASETSADRMLWRLDTDRRCGRLSLYVQSHVEPDWRRLTLAHPGYCLDPVDADMDENPSGPKDISHNLRFIPDQVLFFRLRANPTVKKKIPGKKNGRRLGLTTEDDQRHWLNNKADRGGFRVISVALSREDEPDNLLKGIKHTGETETRLSLLSVRFEGQLVVTDPDLFLKTLKSGIGSGKGFGFGLLSLARA